MTRPAGLDDPDGLRAALLSWYAGHRRAMPWRAAGGPVDPYAIWISEVMLQQTRVATAAPYFARWMARFPTVAALAAADDADVLAAWQGLGYYHRARNVHRAARAVVERHGGALPRTAAALAALPGIGPYTAGAVASIAFGERVPAIDGNARRVLGRLLALDLDAATGPGARAVAATAARLVDGPAPGDLNQAIMELGATVCTPRRPACDRCPAASWCAGRRSGDPTAFPARRQRPRPRPVAADAWFVTDDQGRRLVARRAPDGLLGGLWEFPLTAPDAPLRDPVRGAPLAAAPAGPALTHVFTHLALTVTPRRARVAAPFTPDPLPAPYDDWRWLPEEAIDDLPVSALMRKLRAGARVSFEGALVDSDAATYPVDPSVAT